jgi:3-hydroxybutyryl-CoA dehydratase
VSPTTEWRRNAAEGRLGVGSMVRFSRTFGPKDVEDFGRLTRDDNPVHTERRWCELKGFRTLVCHGLLVGSMVCEPGGQWGWLATGMSFRFRKPVYVGDTVTCELRIVELDERHFARADGTMTNQDGEIVLTVELSGYLPDAPAQALLGEIERRGN